MTRDGSMRPASIHCCSRPRFRGSMGIANLHISHRARALRIGETHLGDSSVDRGLTADEADIRTVGMKEHEAQATSDSRIWVPISSSDRAYLCPRSFPVQPHFRDQRAFSPSLLQDCRYSSRHFPHLLRKGVQGDGGKRASEERHRRRQDSGPLLQTSYFRKC